MNTYRNAAGTVVEAEPDSKLDRRLAGLHIWEQVHTCPDCGFESATAGGLASHQRTHEDDE